MNLICLSGERGSGKTTLCMKIIEKARSLGFRVSGIISPGVFESGNKIAINAVNLLSSEIRPLAMKLPEGKLNPQGLHWDFDETVVRWANDSLLHSYPTDVLMIDELGPLELIHNKGWIEGITAINSHAYHTGFLVIRPELLAECQRKWPSSEILFVEKGKDQASLLNHIEIRLSQINKFNYFGTTLNDQDWVDDFMSERWGSKWIVAHGEKIYPSLYPGIGVLENDKLVGLVTFRAVSGAVEVLTLNSLESGRGIGRNLLGRVIQEANKMQIHKIILITTNDNLRALGFYQKFGFRITGINPGGVDDARKIKPEIPFLGEENLPIHDEICLEFTW